MAIRRNLKLFVFSIPVILIFLFIYSLLGSEMKTAEIGARDITLKTDKTVYEAGEKVNIIATRSNFPEEGKEDYLKVSGCEFSIDESHKWNGEDTARMGGPAAFSCDSSAPDPFPSEIGKSESKEIVWDQKMCEAFGNLEDYHLVPAAPGEYEIKVSCTVADYRGSSFEGITYGGIGDSKDIVIKEPPSCVDKKLELVQAKYENGKVAIDVKNIGKSDIDYIRFYINGCSDKSKESYQYTMHVESGLKSGETKKYLITPKDTCQYSKVQAHIYECSDDNVSTWYKKNISN